MQSGNEGRRLAAILCADVFGYSRLMGMNEERTIGALRGHRSQLIDPKIAEHRGRIANTAGDSILAEFASVVDAVRCAVEIQKGMMERNADVREDLRVVFRIGINVGDIISQGQDIYGDGVNIAARLEALAQPGGIMVSRAVRDQVRDKLSFAFQDLGEHRVKNIARPVEVWQVRFDVDSMNLPAPPGLSWSRRLKPLHWMGLVAGTAVVAALIAVGAWQLRRGITPPGCAGSLAIFGDAHSEQVFSVAISPNGTTALSGSADNEMWLWDLAAGRKMQAFKSEEDIVRVTFSPDGKWALSGTENGQLKLWDVAKGVGIRTFDKVQPMRRVNSIAFSPDGTRIASSSNDNVAYLWNSATGKVVHELKGHASAVHAIVFTPDGLSVVSGSQDKRLLVWDVATGEPRQTLVGHTSSILNVAMSPDGMLVASGDLVGNIKLWDNANPKGAFMLKDKERSTIKAHEGEVASLAFSPDGAWLASAGEGGNIRVWDVATAKELRRVSLGIASAPNSVAFSRDGKSLLSGSKDGKLRRCRVG
jgi:WD40 repeat protein/class 3 adenylate cyclase